MVQRGVHIKGVYLSVWMWRDIVKCKKILIHTKSKNMPRPHISFSQEEIDGLKVVLILDCRCCWHHKLVQPESKIRFWDTSTLMQQW